jgi:hypothetical protein
VEDTMSVHTESFNPADYAFKWTEDRVQPGCSLGWYEWSYDIAHRIAKEERDSQYKLYKSKGLKVRRWVLKNQTIRRGGIGSGHPDIELVVNVYKLDVGCK